MNDQIEWPTFNINNYVKVTLTELGADIYNHRHDDANRFFGLEIKSENNNAGDIIKIQLWDAMKVFGKYFGNGQPLPFKTTIFLDMENDNE